MAGKPPHLREPVISHFLSLFPQPTILSNLSLSQLTSTHIPVSIKCWVRKPAAMTLYDEDEGCHLHTEITHAVAHTSLLILLEGSYTLWTGGVTLELLEPFIRESWGQMRKRKKCTGMICLAWIGYSLFGGRVSMWLKQSLLIHENKAVQYIFSIVIISVLSSCFFVILCCTHGQH